MERILRTEWLDLLPAEDAQATRSRCELVRLNRLMGHPALLASVLAKAGRREPLRRLADLGAGNGQLLLRVAQRLPPPDASAKLWLVDRQPTVTPGTLSQFAALGWEAEAVTADVFDWLNRLPPKSVEVFVATLFLHHFTPAQLAGLFRLAAERALVVVACEPRRSRFALLLARCVGLIGCNATTRHDAPISVRAGFDGRELSGLWPTPDGWRLEERPAGLFTHLFVARRTGEL